VVDVTGLNPNVLYELGVAHAFHRPVVLIVDEPNAIPFDTRSEAHVVLPGGAALAARSVADCRPKLFEALREAQSATVPPGPVAAAEAQLIAPEISGSEAAELLMSTIAELSARLESLEAVAPRFRASESPVTTSTRTIAGRQRALGATGADSLGLQPGDFVFHPKWGVGQVVVVVGTGDRAEAGVTFETVGEKRLNLSLAPIRRYNPEAETEVYGNEAE
jgi:hypothetical protein